MRRLLLLSAVALAPVAVHAQTATAPTPAAALPSDSLAARAAHAEALFFGGKTADIRAMADSTFASILTDERHQAALTQVAFLGASTPNGEWTTFDARGRHGFRRAYTVGSQAATFVVVFHGDGRIGGMAFQPAQN